MIIAPRRLLVAVGCFLLILAGGTLRLAGTNWDEGANLHPDERHMMFVVSDTQVGLEALNPGQLSAGQLWFATGLSPLDPQQKGRLYVYGQLPHLAVVIAAELSGTAGWPHVLLLARTMGAIVDSYTVLAVFLLASIVLRNAVASLVAAAFYAFSPLAIQQSNFFAVDAWLTGAGTWCLVASTMLFTASSYRKALRWAALAGALAGLALACKLPGLAFTPVLVASATGAMWRAGGKFHIGRLLIVLLVGLVANFAAFRLASPFIFQGPGFFGLLPTQAFVSGILELRRLPLDMGFPPAWQWIAGYSLTHAIFDLAIWGFGPPATVALICAFAVFLRWPPGIIRMLPTALLVMAFAVYYLASSASALRYALPAFPGLYVMAAMAVSVARPSLQAGCASLLVIAAGVWSLGMVSLHTTSNSRVAASRWLWTTTAKGTAVANESHWDDGLPVPVRLPGQSELTWPGAGDHFKFLSLEIEFPDTADKARKMAATLDEADLVVLSSERMRKPMTALAHHFPLSAAYYRLLASGDLCFERAYRDKRGYPVLGYKFNDESAQETWSVYDHPTVEIYRKLDCFDAARVEAQLLSALRPQG